MSKSKKLPLKLVLGNSLCRLENADRETMLQFRRKLSYTVPTRTRFGFANVRKFLVNRRGEFPSGLMYLASDWLKEDASRTVHVESTQIEVPPNLDLFNLQLPFTPRQEQVDAAEAIFAHGGGVASMPTGSGKSAVISLLINKFKVRTLIVTPNTGLKKQLAASLSSWFGKDAVGPGKAIWVQNVQALKITEQLKGYDLLIMDEVHHSAASTYRKLNEFAWQNIRYRCGLTATFFRTLPHEQLLLHSILSKVVYTLDYKTAVEKGYVVPVQCFYYELPKLKDGCSGSGWTAVYKELVVNRGDRNELIAHLTSNLINAGYPSLVLAKQIDHGEDIQRRLKERGHDVPFAEGKNDLNRELLLEFNLKQRPALLGTMGVMSEGCDTVPAEWVVIGGAGKSQTAFMQAVGRVMRPSPGKEVGTVVLFLDKTHKWLSNHFAEQRKFMREEYGCEPVKLELPKEIFKK